ncbi:rhodanese-like domain-containing protein [Luteimonas sp. SJ-92]|uniref:Rhodanese-like domain-containing protein n=1 Tax=Luteimonas salinisoli TaxID=2752307 RepID=A0A853J7P5_9GAMM|nr:rhodanese-like domain-containing protein [Luteimonas salinisoli]NZA25166.1 rhodanese-like domain-containing protein [Luteimonas salinisoli]
MIARTRRSLHEFAWMLAGAAGTLTLASFPQLALSTPSTCPLAVAPVAAQGTPTHAAAEDRSCLISARAVASDAEIYDLRSRSEYLEFHIPGARHSNPAELSRILRGTGGTAVVYDSGKFRSDAFLLCARLRNGGLHNFKVVDGGIAAWTQALSRPERLAVSRLSDAEVSAALSSSGNSAQALGEALGPVLSEHRIRRTAAAGSGRRIFVADPSTPTETIAASMDRSSSTAFYWVGSPDRLVALIHAHLAQDQRRALGPGQSATCPSL